MRGKSKPTGSTSSSFPAALGSLTADVKPKHVLIIDDSDEDRDVCRVNLTTGGDFTFTEVTSGCEGLKRAVDGHFDCIILDHVMPDMDGIELLERYLAVRNDPDPVVFVTGRGDERLAVRALKLGACDYLPKTDLNSPAVYRAVRNAVDRRNIERSLRRSREDLRVARDRAESANQAKSVFLANMSHEIRTPLTAIMGFTELLASGGQDEVTREAYLGAVRRNGQSLMRIINDVLDMSKIEAGRLDVEQISVNLPGLLEDVVQLFRGEAGAKNLTLTGRWDEDLPAFVLTDPTRVRQILHNATANAIKFTERGGVELTAAAKPDGEYVRVTIGIADTGVGIAADQFERVFEPFQQGDLTVNRRFGGTGLGLSLCRRLAEALGGSFELTESTLGVGSLFTLDLRLRRSREKGKSRAGPGRAALHRLRGARILVIEDSPDSRELIKEILIRQGAEVTAAKDGAEALQTIARQAFDLVLTDLQMPVMDGIETLRALRRRGVEKPVVGLSAHAFDDERARALDEGFDAYLTKPINVAELLGCVSGLLDPARVPRAH